MAKCLIWIDKCLVLNAKGLISNLNLFSFKIWTANPFFFKKHETEKYKSIYTTKYHHHHGNIFDFVKMYIIISPFDSHLSSSFLRRGNTFGETETFGDRMRVVAQKLNVRKHRSVEPYAIRFSIYILGWFVGGRIVCPNVSPIAFALFVPRCCPNTRTESIHAILVLPRYLTIDATRAVALRQCSRSLFTVAVSPSLLVLPLLCRTAAI